MKTFSITDKGKSREMNQDFMFTSMEPVGNLPNLFIVADGMGGHNAGDYASRYAVEMIVEEISTCKEQKPAVILQSAVDRANCELVRKAALDIALQGMGTTAVIATLLEDRLWVANVGDSRLYLLNNEIQQITKDHSLVEEMVARGKLVRGSEAYKMQKNIITRALGVEPAVELDIFSICFAPGDRLLLCSDGLTNLVADEELLSHLGPETEPENACSSLMELALERGANDNVTLAVLKR